MKKYDNKVPLELKSIQEWFGGVVANPIDRHSKINRIAPSGRLIEFEAAEFISPSPTLRPFERIQIYNQQYWWRLLNVLHELNPLTVRLLGYTTFNIAIGIPFLKKYPPNHWSLNLLTERLPRFMQKDYKGFEKKLMSFAVEADWAFNHAFIAEELPSLSSAEMDTNEKLEELLEKPLTLQPHIHLFCLPYDLFKLRAFLIERPVDHCQNHGRPHMEMETHHAILYRNSKNEISWKKISEAEYYLLSLFKMGTSINQSCEQLEKQSDAVYQQAMEHLQEWFQEWTRRGWLRVL